MARPRFNPALLLAALTACDQSGTDSKPAPQGATTVTAPATPAAPPAPPTVEVHSGDLMQFKPLPSAFPSENNSVTEAKTALGQKLFHDPRLSKNQDVSCSSCHGLDTYGVDRKPVSEGHRKQKGGRNAPSVYNAAGHVAQFWDGRAEDVERQALGPVLNPIEMAMPNPEAVVKVISSIPGYAEEFAKAFPESKPALTFENFGKAVGAFERTLLTPAPWDEFLKGDKSALSNEQKAGFTLFVETGCVTCHQGPLVGASMFKKLGEKEPWPALTDRGRAEVTKSDVDANVFKVPSLRNITETGPYFHDGSVASLNEAVRLMAKHQLAKTLSDADVAKIVAWLGALKGPLPEIASKGPALPASGPKTPKPDPK